MFRYKCTWLSPSISALHSNIKGNHLYWQIANAYCHQIATSFVITVRPSVSVLFFSLLYTKTSHLVEIKLPIGMKVKQIM